MDLLHSVYNHLVLPPKLPGHEDSAIQALSQNVLTRLTDACKRLVPLTPQPLSDAFRSLQSSLVASQEINSGFINKISTLQHFRHLDRVPNRVLIFHVVEQNAALLLYQTQGSGGVVLFEAFEASAPAERILTAGNAMQRDFPGRCAQLSTADFSDASFQEHLAEFLEQASMDSLYSLRAHARKAGASVTESRDTTDPALVTHMLMPLLEAMGSPAQVPVLQKRVRDDVNLKNANVPWRRLPFWLVLRVGALRQLCCILGYHQGRACYKFLICMVLAQLLEDCAGRLSPDMTILLRAKLCRRMAKLEMDRNKTKSPEDTRAYDDLFGSTRALISEMVQKATDQVEKAWNSFQQASIPRILKLPLRAPSDALQLSLPHSGEYLDRLLSYQPPPQPAAQLAQLPRPLDMGIQRVQEFTGRIVDLAAAELGAERESDGDTPPGQARACELRCLALAEKIQTIIAKIGPASEWDPEQNSTLALTAFDLWVRMDACAVAACPLLGGYLPTFRPELLDVLQLATLASMRRLNKVQTYLAKRQQLARSTVLSEARQAAAFLGPVGKDCLSARFAADSRPMQELESRIQGASDRARRTKEVEWRHQCEKYDQLSEAIQQSTCVCSVDPNGKKKKTPGPEGCKRCALWCTRKRLRIAVHEDYLPPSHKPAQRAAVLFEIDQPTYLSAYRDATWLILTSLAHPGRPCHTTAPKATLAQCGVLAAYRTGKKSPSRITLASRKKCFAQTHYRFSAGRAPLSEVLLPLAAEFELFDTLAGLWVGDLDKSPTLQHLCGIQVPAGLSATVLPACLHPEPEVEGPSSYQVLANQTECPSTMPVHEFSACQKLLGGHCRRWPNILVELGSINLSMGSEETARLICQLAVQAGPRGDWGEGAEWRTVHTIFREEPAFVERLLEQIETRLGHISSNWRETWCMDMLATLALRVFSLSAERSMKRKAQSLLEAMQKTTLAWVVRLRDEVHRAAGADAAERMATYAFSSALLARRTLATHLESGSPLRADELTAWVKASVALQENLLVGLDKLSPTLRAMFVRDTRMAFRMEPMLRSAVKSYPSSVGVALLDTLAHLSLPSWTFLPSPDDKWIRATTATAKVQPGFTYHGQAVHFHIVDGHLLVNGRPREKLPANIRGDAGIEELFGNQHLLTYPSPLPGMTHQLLGFRHQQVIHFGTRGNQEVVIQAVTADGLTRLEFIPRRVFFGPHIGSGLPDLPLGLLDNCVHWLNLTTRQIEIRRKPAIWLARQRDWTVHVRERYAQRASVQLIDPHSPLFRQIAGTLGSFVRPEKVTVFQPLALRGRLSAEMKELDLSLFVNDGGLIEFRELKAEMDPDQDAGTWYGLQGKVVLRNIVNPRKRSVILPLGDDIWAQRQGVHVEVRVDGGSVEYAKFDIDDTLGRLVCPPEPRLLYTKALCHALTSFCLPDPLTGRTGTEEAIHVLRSGAAQPWTQLGTLPTKLLHRFRDLLPSREYYPPGMKRFQTATWDDRFTTTIQHDALDTVLCDIMDKSDRLAKFADNGSTTRSDDEAKRPAHLRFRANMQRRLYERRWMGEEEEGVPAVVAAMSDTMAYHGRDRASRIIPQSGNVFNITRAIRRQSFLVDRRHKDVPSILKGWPRIGGLTSRDAAHRTAAVAGPLAARIETSVSEHWGELVRFCQTSNSQVSVIFRLGLLAFAPEADMDTIHHLAAFAFINELRGLELPPCLDFWDLGSRGPPSLETLESLIATAYTSAEGPSAGRKLKAKQRARLEVARVLHQRKCEADGRSMACLLLKHWPRPWPTLVGFMEDTLRAPGTRVEHIHITQALGRIRPEWERRHHSEELVAYIGQVQAILNRHMALTSLDTSVPASWLVQPATADALRIRDDSQKAAIPLVSGELVTKRGPASLKVSSHIDATTFRFRDSKETAKAMPNSIHVVPELTIIFNRFAGSADSLRRQYGQDLLESLTALDIKARTESTVKRFAVPGIVSLDSAVAQAHADMVDLGSRLSGALAAGDERSHWLELGGLWPCANTPISLLCLLRSRSGHRFGPGMKEALVAYGLAISHLQKLGRLRTALCQGNQRAVDEELQNLGHENWDPVQHADWLLMELDGGFLIRAEQIEVARAIIAPRLGRNSVLQMNMGKGKTSCIVPMAVAALADGENLARLVVPKPLLLQTAQTVQARLGGLAGREVRHIAFSRRTPTTSPVMDLYEDLHRETYRSRGLVISTHEQLLSFKLSGWQRLVDATSMTAITPTAAITTATSARGKKQKQKSGVALAAVAAAAADRMIRFQDWLERTSRDILDESDYTLAVKTQLIYPSGPETTVDGHPFRWLVAEGLLALVEHHLPSLQKEFPGSIEVVRRSGGAFPRVQFLRDDVQSGLQDRVVDDICTGRAWFLRPGRGTMGLARRVAAVRRVLSEEHISDELLGEAVAAFADAESESAAKKLLTARGLLVCRVLVLCLGRRWNVQYGLSPDRHPIAVPFEAKGVPSLHAEFGHPDVAIVLTCLAFYYTGLTMPQFLQGLQHVLRSDDPAAQYERWTSLGYKKLPPALCQWNAINVDDAGQVGALWQHLRCARNVVDDYMNVFVFPAHAKQFGTKLQVSAWDVPLLPKGRPQEARTTGFSGTNDSRIMLPLTIRQDDLPRLRDTNAEVLSYLLQPRNRKCLVAVDAEGSRLTEEGLLYNLHGQNIRILIDAGAYILEMDNRSLVERWLRIDHAASAAVYFDASSRAWVMYRGGTKTDVPLLATPFVDDLSECLVYLDEAHTRGIDLKLPPKARGGLTLALGQTKDFTVQAAMRLRQLGTTQSVTFFTPPEVDRSIRDTCKLSVMAKLTSYHVVSWLLEQTCRAHEDLRDLYLAQGADFIRRTDTAWRFPKPVSNKTHCDALLAVLQQPETQTLEKLYGGAPAAGPSRPGPAPPSAPRLRALADQLAGSFGGAARHRSRLGDALAEVEQEREVELQVEEMRVVQKPPRHTPLAFPGLHPTIAAFARTGILGEAFEHAFAYLGKTDLGRQFGLSGTGSKLFVSREFGRGVKLALNVKSNDNFLRPVEWIIWSSLTETALVVIPEEAELVIPIVRMHAGAARGNLPNTHLLAYAAPVAKTMRMFNSLSYYSVPTLPADHSFPDWFRMELGVLAGRLYADFDECGSLAGFLRLPETAENHTQDAPEVQIASQAGHTPFAENAAPFLLEWLSTRRGGQDVLQTPVGTLVNGPDPGNCARVNCSYNRAIIWYDDNPTNKAMTWEGIRNGAQTMLNLPPARHEP
ncbi:hypothetical protein B0T25DRAFT_614272 [Lasiosphaeria hispida]|uniref:ubiquitinyl hydrolase 1 n=1 Tax=Lasiosphaeria hispida TaxID=260671 RepID=A0AAJ0MBV3_9PEZI|nr:hypothetical protein B0T25DRAFT_614272 [Lasiosphaeria hispida]